jgi:hypothetical protein
MFGLMMGFKIETCSFTVKNKYAALSTMVHKNLLHCCLDIAQHSAV